MNNIYKKDVAKYYDIINIKNYPLESRKIKQLIKQYKKSAGIDLLDVACGTGGHIKYLKQSYSIVGVDKSNDMLNIARKNFSDVKFKQGDMIDFKLHKKFDVIICLARSIGFVKSYENLTKTIENFYSHLKSGGVAIIEPWLPKEKYKYGITTMSTYTDELYKIALFVDYKKRGYVSVMDEYYLVAEKNKPVISFNEHYELGMFEVEKVLQIMRQCGFKSKFIKTSIQRGPTGVYVCVKV